MIFFSIGLPSLFAEWCDTFAFQAAFHALGPVGSVAADSLEELGLMLLEAGSSNVAVRSRHPDGKLRRAIIDSSVKFVLALPKPAAAVEDLVTKSGYTLTEAVRAVGTSCASMHSFAADMQNALVLRIGEGNAAAIETAEAICRHLGFPLSSDEIVNIVTDLGLSCFHIHGEAASSWWEALDQRQRQLVEGALNAYSPMSPTRSLEPIIWERELFFLGSVPAQAAVHTVDVTGRVRCLLYGPYIMVPAGIWTANITIACSKEVAGMSFMIEILSGQEQLGQTRFQPDNAGVFEVSMSFLVEKNSALPLEIRLFNERAAFDGRLGLGSVTLIHSAGVSPEDRSKISDALGLDLERAR